MDATMLGVGVGFDCKGAGKLTILVVSWVDVSYRGPIHLFLS